MKIVFIHYHLRPGGVTTVIRRQIAALSGAADCLVITGEAPPDDFPGDIAVVPGIGYTLADAHSSRSREVAEKSAAAVMTAIFRKWKDGCDICHVHNPLLAKNQHFLKILSILQDSGLRLFLQVHDFAENGRPNAYFSKDPYPPNCHYGVINSRDQAILRKAGLLGAGLHLIPNYVEPLHIDTKTTFPKELILYPVRAIKRKNIGEALFISLFFPPGRIMAITMAPTSPADHPTYRRWRRLQADYHLPVLFEAARQYGFSELVGAAACMLTTSVTEGFGFAFLEPWTVHRLLAGRRIDHACRDFETNGLMLDHLYSRILIPLDAFDLDRFYHQWQTVFARHYARFHMNRDSCGTTRAFNSILENDGIDFGYLDETAQEQVLRNMLADTSLKHEIMMRNPFLEDIVRAPDPDRRIRHNREAVMRQYHGSVHRRQLMDCYDAVIRTPVRHAIDKKILARQFLDPKQFYMIHWENGHVL